MERRTNNESPIRKSARKTHEIVMSEKTSVLLSGYSLFAGSAYLLEGDLKMSAIMGIGALAAGTAVAIEKGKKSNRKKRSEL